MAAEGCKGRRAGRSRPDSSCVTETLPLTAKVVLVESVSISGERPLQGPKEPRSLPLRQTFLPSRKADGPALRGISEVWGPS